MTREEIEQLNDVRPYCFETDMEEDWYKIGCIDGLNAADAEPDTTSIWHDAREKPNKCRSLVLFDNGVLVLVREVTSWEEIKSKYKFSKWAYYDSFVITNKIELVDTELLLEEK